MSAPVTFTLDLEDHREHAGQEVRFPQLTRQVLDFLDDRGVRGTFFVVGEIAEQQPELVYLVSLVLIFVSISLNIWGTIYSRYIK